jgi:predicted ATP-binding protein involved in virulence
MHLKNVTLRNFRCFEKLALDLHPRLTVLVAENGGGKTAILDGIAIGLSPVLRYLSSANQRLSGPGIEDTDFHLMTVVGGKGKKRETTSDYAQVVIETTNGLVWDNWRAASKGKHPEAKVGQSSIATYASAILDSLTTAEPKLLPVFAYYGARRGWIVIPERLRGSKVDYDQPTAALFGALDDLTDFKELVNWFYLEDAAEARANRGEPEDYEEFSSLAAVRNAISAILGGTYTNPHFSKQHKFVIESQIGPGVLQISQLSQGYQSMLALGMDFARRLALANDHMNHDIKPILEEENYWVHDEAVEHSQAWASPSLFAPAIMLVDEIDLHLHPSWQQRVLGDLMRAFPRTQFIVTTHSPQVLTTLRKENIRILACDEDGHWTASEPSISPLAHESGDALAMIMGTHPRPEISDIMPDLYAYEHLARAGRAESEEARQIKARLDAIGYEFNEADQALFTFLAAKAEKSKNETP